MKTIPSKSFHSMLHLVYRENFLLTCAMKISVANLLQFVALMLKNDNSIDAEKRQIETYMIRYHDKWMNFLSIAKWMNFLSIADY